MFGLGPTELIVIVVLALLVLGPQRIPEAASSLGKAIRGFRRATRELKDQIDLDDEVRRPFEDLRSALRDEPASVRPIFPPLVTAPGEDTFPRVPNDESTNGRGHYGDGSPPPETVPATTPGSAEATAPTAGALPAATEPTVPAAAAPAAPPPPAPAAPPPPLGDATAAAERQK